MTERTESWRRFIPYLAAFLCGLIACLGLPFWNIWPATLIGFAFFYTLIAPITNAKSGFILGFFFGLGYFLLGLYWIGNALFINWDDYWWAYPFALLGLPLFLSCFWGTAMAIATHFSASNSLHRFILTVLCLSFVEWVRGWAFTGFPWNLTGYIWNAQLEIAQISHVIGIYLLSLITIFWGLGLGFTGLLIKQKHKIKASALGLFLLFSFIATFVYGQQRLDQSAEPLAQNQHKTLIVQPNIPQALKWQSDLMLDHIGNLLSLSRYDAQKHGDVSNTKQLFIVWPETAMSDIYFEHKAIKDALTSALQSWPVEDVTLFTGMLHSNEENAGYYNSLYQINAQGELINRYDKSHLVPFGEYIPYLPPNIIEPLVGIVGFSAGEEERNLIAGDIALIPLICY